MKIKLMSVENIKINKNIRTINIIDILSLISNKASTWLHFLWLFDSVLCVPMFVPNMAIKPYIALPILFSDFLLTSEYFFHKKP